MNGNLLRSRLTRHAPQLTVGLITAIGMVLVLTQHWRKGAALLGAALLVAAVLRMALSDDRAGLLAIRGRVIDVICYSGFGIVIIALAVTITRGSLTAP